MNYDLTAVPNLLMESFHFPDGQPHVAVNHWSSDDLSISTRIASCDDLVKVLLVADTLRRSGIKELRLRISYLMGARMDRPMPRVEGRDQPFTLKVVTDILKTGGFSSISIFDPHSEVSTALLDAKAILPISQVDEALGKWNNAGFDRREVVLLAPDAGAAKRVETIAASVSHGSVGYAIKKRDPSTGKLSGFRLLDPEMVKDKPVLIVDDLCDGGGTFAGVGGIIKEAGASTVGLYVSHGVFSKGFDITNVDRIFTTNSYQPFDDVPPHVTVLPWQAR